MRTFFIEVERQGWTLAVVKVEAETLDEAINKALRAIHSADDISEIFPEAITITFISSVLKENKVSIKSSMVLFVLKN